MRGEVAAKERTWWRRRHALEIGMATGSTRPGAALETVVSVGSAERDEAELREGGARQEEPVTEGVPQASHAQQPDDAGDNAGISEAPTPPTQRVLHAHA